MHWIQYTITFDLGYKTITEEYNVNDSVKFPTTDNEFASVEYWTVNGEKIESASFQAGFNFRVSVHKHYTVCVCMFLSFLWALYITSCM